MSDVLKIFGLNVFTSSYDDLLKKIEEKPDIIVAPLTVKELVKSFFYIDRKNFYNLVDYFYVDSRLLFFLISIFYKKIKYELSTYIMLEMIRKHKKQRVLLLGLEKEKVKDFLGNIKRFEKEHRFTGIIEKKIAFQFEKQSAELINKIKPNFIIVNNDLSNRKLYLSFFKDKKDYQSKYILFDKAIRIYLKTMNTRKVNIQKRLISSFQRFSQFSFNFLFFPVYLVVLLFFIASLVMKKK